MKDFTNVEQGNWPWPVRRAWAAAAPRRSGADALEPGRESPATAPGPAIRAAAARPPSAARRRRRPLTRHARRRLPAPHSLSAARRPPRSPAGRPSRRAASGASADAPGPCALHRGPDPARWRRRARGAVSGMPEERGGGRARPYFCDPAYPKSAGRRPNNLRLQVFFASEVTARPVARPPQPLPPGISQQCETLLFRV